MREKVIPLQKIILSYKEKRWPVRRIANHFGVTRQAIYERLRNSNVELERELKSNFNRLDKAKLLATYNSPLTIPEVARKLGTTIVTLKRELDFYGIPRRKGNPSKIPVPDIAKDLKVGESILINEVNGKIPRMRLIYKRAKAAGRKISIRKANEGGFILTRIT